MVPSGNPTLQAREERWREGDGKGEDGRHEAERVAALPLPCYGARWGAAGWPQPGSGQLRVLMQEGGGSPVLWLGLTQTPPHPLTAPRPP